MDWTEINNGMLLWTFFISYDECRILCKQTTGLESTQIATHSYRILKYRTLMLNSIVRFGEVRPLQSQPSCYSRSNVIVEQTLWEVEQ